MAGEAREPLIGIPPRHPPRPFSRNLLMALSESPPLLDILRNRFGLDGFRPGQAAILSSVLAGNATGAGMPAGSGQSLCYHLPAPARVGPCGV